MYTACTTLPYAPNSLTRPSTHATRTFVTFAKHLSAEGLTRRRVASYAQAVAMLETGEARLREWLR